MKPSVVRSLAYQEAAEEGERNSHEGDDGFPPGYLWQDLYW